MKTTTILTIALAFCFYTNGQNINLEITENTENPYLLGKIDKRGLEGDNYKEWFTENYNNYEPKSSVISSINSILNGFEIKVFMGTWCGDSKREVPKLYKILEASEFPMDQLTVVAVSRQADSYKQSPHHEEAGLNIHRVPTFIFYKDGIEVNRIVEYPVKSLEEDIQNIITVNDYKSNYYIVDEIESLLKSAGLEGFKKQISDIYNRYKPELYDIYELNTYAHILFTTDRVEEAIEVLKLNVKLFPEESEAFDNLATKLHKSGAVEEALKYYEEALKLDPENGEIKKKIASLKSN